MSCLTRSMQRELSRYIKTRVSRPWRQNPKDLRKMLISQGVCPSSITVDQMSVILEGIN